jgi:hypothetical protein
MADLPLSMPSNGSMLVKFVLAIADTAAPTVGEINAGSATDLSCYITELTTNTTENTIEDPRLCSVQVFQARGDNSSELEVTYVYNTLSEDDDEARIALTEGEDGFFVIRYGVAADDAISAGDVVDVYPVQMGVQRKNTPSRNSVHTITQKPFVTGTIRFDAVVAA